MKITFTDNATPKTGAVVVGVEEGKKLSPAAQAADADTGGAVSRMLKTSKFSGKSDQLETIAAPANVAYDALVLVGLGKDPDKTDFLSLGGKIYTQVKNHGEVTVICDAKRDDLAEAAASLAHGMELRSYRFDKYRTKEGPDAKPSLKKAVIQVAGATKARNAFKPLAAVAEGVKLTRDLVSEPPNVLYPESFAQAVKELEKDGIKVEILTEKRMERLGMGALLGVGQGSARESRMAIMQWNGAARNKQPVAFVGKGVTFDTGGISIKPAAGMEEMKWDMGGAGVVTGLMKGLALRKAKVNAVGVIGLVENMPGGNAQRPGDIVTSMSGQTIEIHNTDAEGRLVLADALWYTKERFKPKIMVNLATLTGAIMVALGQENAGLFSNDDDLAEKLTAAGLATKETVWRMPMGDAYDNLLKTDGADMKNIGGRYGGSITAAQFLQRFVDKTHWAHLDIAGVTWSSKDSAVAPRGATGFGVRLLDRLVADNYEG